MMRRRTGERMRSAAAAADGTAAEETAVSTERPAPRRRRRKRQAGWMMRRRKAVEGRPGTAARHRRHAHRRQIDVRRDAARVQRMTAAGAPQMRRHHAHLKAAVVKGGLNEDGVKRAKGCVESG